MMTEEQARQTQCPILLVAVALRGETSRWCAASKCQMWRHERTETVYTGQDMIVQMDDGSRGIRPEKVDVDHGFCGLAGKP